MVRASTVAIIRRLTHKLTGAGARSMEGTNIGHQNGEALTSGIRVESTVRLWREGTMLLTQVHRDFVHWGTRTCMYSIRRKERCQSKTTD